MDDGAIALLEILASRSRQRILSLLEEGVDHPEELARRLKLRRQGIDKQLLELYRWGFVDRSAVLPADGRPRIVYRISAQGRDVLARAEALAREYREAMRADHQRGVDHLEAKLAAGDLDEREYLAKREELDARYAAFFT